MGDTKETMREPHSSVEMKKEMLSWDEVIENNLAKFGRKDLLQPIIVAIAIAFDSQQAFVAIYTDAFPPWHCTNHTTTCSSNICNLPNSSWSWNSNPSMTIISHWGLRCANTFITGLPQSSFFMGCLFGSVLLASLADTYFGRKKMLFFSCLSMSIASLLITLSPNIWVYSSLKFVIGFCRSCIGNFVLVLTTERVSPEWRFRVGVVVYFFFGLGYMSLPGIAYVTRNMSWKYVYLWTSLPSICYCFIAYPFVKESPRWLLAQGRVKQLKTMLKNDANVDDIFHKPLPKLNNVSFFKLYSSLGELFEKRWALLRLGIVMVLGIGIGMVYFSLPLAVGNLGTNIYIAVVLTAFMEVPSCIALYLLESYRRKPSLLAFSLLSGICSILCVVVGNKAQEVKVVLAMISFFGACTAYDVYLIYILELFPTCVRNTASSLARQAVVFACIFSPFFVSLGRKNIIFSYGVFGVLILCSNVTLLYLPETKGTAFCETMDQQEKEEICLTKPKNQEAALRDTIDKEKKIDELLVL